MNTDIFSGTKKATHLSGFFKSWSGKRDSYLVSYPLKSKGFIFLPKQRKTQFWTYYWNVSRTKN
jgi:hypothetical protein